MSLPPLSVYVHFPWCVSKCPYCDFNSHALKDDLPEEAYLAALAADLAAQSSRVAGRKVISVFMGGGTPSLFSPRAIGRVIESLARDLNLAPDAEVTLEANPATVERGRFAEYRAAGINRVSLGAQSFSQAQLTALGRIHSIADVTRAATELHAASLSNFNLDLMFGLPAQTRALALADLTAALQLAPAHLSHYQLTMEPGTVFAAHPPELPDEDEIWGMQGDCHALLAARGFAQYEVSAFALAGRQCLHNLNYWHFGDYLGIGAGAHGKFSARGNPLRLERSTHLREPRRYLASAAGGPTWRAVPAEDFAFEFMMNALRLNQGFAMHEFHAFTGMPAESIQPQLAHLSSRGLLEAVSRDGNPGWRATLLGRRFLNDLIGSFLPGTNSQASAGS